MRLRLRRRQRRRQRVPAPAVPAVAPGVGAVGAVGRDGDHPGPLVRALRQLRGRVVPRQVLRARRQPCLQARPPPAAAADARAPLRPHPGAHRADRAHAPGHPRLPTGSFRNRHPGKRTRLHESKRKGNPTWAPAHRCIGNSNFHVARDAYAMFVRGSLRLRQQSKVPRARLINFECRSSLFV